MRIQSSKDVTVSANRTMRKIVCQCVRGLHLRDNNTFVLFAPSRTRGPPLPNLYDLKSFLDGACALTAGVVDAHELLLETNELPSSSRHSKSRPAAKWIHWHSWNRGNQHSGSCSSFCSIGRTLDRSQAGSTVLRCHLLLLIQSGPSRPDNTPTLPAYRARTWCGMRTPEFIKKVVTARALPPVGVFDPVSGSQPSTHDG